MIPARRARFNRDFTPAAHAAVLDQITRRLGVPVEFRVSETPCFFPASLLDRLSQAALDMVATLVDDAAYRAAADAIVPAEFRLARGEARPTFLQVDFGLVRAGDTYEGRLVELQAFPSLYAFQPVLAAAYVERHGLSGVHAFLSGLTDERYHDLCRQAIVGRHDPEEVVLLEIDPAHQKTLPDFVASRQAWGVATVDVRDVRREGRRLVYPRDGRMVPIARIYNRVVPDDLTRRGATLAFDFRDDLDVEWTGGPDWFFRISKFSLPWLRHPWVPETRRLDTVDRLPVDRDDWILKPLFSFAGGGIVFGPTDAEVAAIPTIRRRDYILQRRVAFTPVIATPHGPTQVEVRIMLVDDQGEYRPVIALGRMGRGKMMGVDHNRNLEWVGATAVLQSPDAAVTEIS
jgi:hypothetical protein